MSDMDLRDMDQEFDNADPETSNFASIPDGTYQAKVESAELVRSKQGKPMLKWCLKIISMPHEGRLVWKYNGIERDKLGWLKGDLGICGLTLDRLSELPRRLRDLLDVPLEIRLVTKNGKDGTAYQNCYFNKKLEFGGTDDIPPPQDDDAPF